MKRRAWATLNPIDQEIRKLIGSGMWNENETLLTIRMFGGFEIFGAYEGWNEGYEITSPRFHEIKATGYALDDAIRNFTDKIKLNREAQCHPEK